jgi:hypothetical protein
MKVMPEIPKLKKAKTISRKFQDIESYIFSKSTIMRIPGVFISSAKSTISQIIIMSYLRRISKDDS